ncbi:hypothetical protein H5S40_04150 [Limosilactobacillus sp. RRLNB_1_1]|uniref:Uncharacterized protein n=1 Tax=Limosilactobacillus albertensis TaxID=2759752 RepID=A0A7W3TR27_9LACO|nr:hypothetical protein [Limosilactobacillus albertensis]MBB1069347.1 hypothetical protein [Limosilactobacillus albertensis]MCD7119049.1 hypothetical protein [Limosilactobacillus albertensis]MCD7128244.1 hypothetical protein [Limosilactobacillus albertensis]
MSGLALPVNLEQQIVNGIMRGEQNYLQMCLRERPKLIVSDGLSWSRSNYIDTFVGKETEDYPDVSYKKAKAGHTWGYLQFVYNQSDDHKSLIFIKNIRTISTQFNGLFTNISEYLNDYAKINNKLVNEGKLKGKGVGKPFQMELLPNVSEVVTEDVDRFYIVTYNHDENGLLSEITLTMPNQQTDKLFQVENLSNLMDNSPIEFTTNELEIAAETYSDTPDSVYGPQKYGFEIPAVQTKTFENKN